MSKGETIDEKEKNKQKRHEITELRIIAATTSRAVAGTAKTKNFFPFSPKSETRKYGGGGGGVGGQGRCRRGARHTDVIYRRVIRFIIMPIRVRTRGDATTTYAYLLKNAIAHMASATHIVRIIRAHRKTDRVSLGLRIPVRP